MLLSFAAVLLVVQAGAVETPSPSSLGDTVVNEAYLDATARELVHRARARQESTAREVRAYQAIGRERISLGFRVLGRERLFFRREIAARIDWNRTDTVRIELLGARQVIPPFMAGVRFADDASSEAAGLAIDPAGDNLFDDLFQDEDREGSWFRHPLAPGSEAHYRFRSGDTTTIRLSDGSTVRLLELEIIPRRRDSRLVRGSILLDAASHAPVRALLRLARPFDLELDAEDLDADAQDGMNEVPGLLLPIRAEVRFLTIEYTLWNDRWWLPRLMALEAIAKVNNFPDIPVRFERSHSYRDVVGDPAAGRLAAGDALLDECPDRDDDADSGNTGDADTMSISIGATGVEIDQAGGDGGGDGTICRCEDGRCRIYAVDVPADTAALIASDYLPPSIYASGETLVSGESVAELIEEMERLAPVPGGFQRPIVRWDVAGLDLLRYNRVESLSIGARATADFGPFMADATARLGVADLEPNIEVGLAREGLSSHLRAAAYRRLAAVDAAIRPLDLGNSLSALLFGRDDGDYFRTLGVELIGTPASIAPQWYEWRFFTEQQTTARKHTDFSLPHLFDEERDFRPMIEAADADQVGASLRLRTWRGLNPTGFRWGAETWMEASTGTFDFVRPSLTLFGAAPLPGALVGSLEVAAGTSFGEIPIQSAWFLGGPAALRGYAPASAIGGSFWRGRAEVATPAPGARIVLFSDAGWAGSRDGFTTGAPLLSAGIGASFLDGLVRIDLARALRGETGWRAEIYLGTGL